MATLKQKATDDSQARDEIPERGYGKRQLNYDTIPENRRSPRNHHRQQNKRRADKKARRHLLQNHPARK
jgi:hypothetical protein